MKLRMPRIFPRFRFIRKITKRLYTIFEIFQSKVNKNIRLQLIRTFALCLFISIIFFTASVNFLSRFNIRAIVSYESGINQINWQSEHLAETLSTGDLSIKDSEAIINKIQNSHGDMKVLITDLDGVVLYKSNNAEEKEIDIYNIIKNSVNKRESYNTRSREEYTSFYPISFKDQRAYLICKAIPQGDIQYYEQGGYSSFLSLILSVVLFFALFFGFTRRKMAYIEELSQGLMEISQGNLDYKVSEKGQDELCSLAKNINHMSEELKQKIEEERLAEKSKSELITNVSHDLRTPLTSIMGYLGLVKDNKYESKEQLNEYANIAFNKSEKLKVLIEDLFEYTKLSNKGVKLNNQEVIINELIAQLIEEFVPLLEENNLKIEINKPNEDLKVYLDPDKTVRVFDNLIMNAIKYSFKPSTIKLLITEKKESVLISISNEGKHIPKEEILSIFERFYKLDKSRNSQSNGSGLGLAICKSIVTMQGGKIWAESIENNITFNVLFPIRSHTEV